MFPKILHLYWGCNRPLSYLRALTVLSFHKLNPDWQIKIWVPDTVSFEKSWDSGEQVDKYFGHDYLFDLPSHFIHEVDFSELGIFSTIPEVHKSDLLRWHLLGTEGGVWSDFDILYIKPMYKEWREGAGLCRYHAVPDSTRLYHAIGFMTSVGTLGKAFFTGLFKLALSTMPQTAYQAYGAPLLEEYLLRHPPEYYYIAPELVYPYAMWNEVGVYFKPYDLSKEGIIGYHWYAGNPRIAPHEARITPETIESLVSEYSICKEALRICPSSIAY